MAARGRCNGRGVEAHRVVARAHHAPIRRHRHARDADVVFGYQLVAALVLAQIPDPDIAAPVAANQLALVRMDHHVVHGHAVRVVPLHIAAACVPDLDCAVLGAGHQPLGLDVECDAGDVGRVPVEGQDGVWVGRLDVVELDRVVAGGGEVALVRRDAEAVHLRVGVGDGAGADAAEGFPEPDSMIIAACAQNDRHSGMWVAPSCWSVVRFLFVSTARTLRAVMLLATMLCWWWWSRALAIPAAVTPSGLDACTCTCTSPLAHSLSFASFSNKYA